MSIRYMIQKDFGEDCITICDKEDELKTSFGSEIVLYPLEDAVRVVDELNVQCSVVDMLVEHLRMYESEEDIKYWIEEIKGGLCE